MFRSRFNDALPKLLPNFGPQDLERDVTESVPGERVEHFLCAVLGLLLNRKQDVKYDAIGLPPPQLSALPLQMLMGGRLKARALQPSTRRCYLHP
jgi:hypothetical protein